MFAIDDFGRPSRRASSRGPGRCPAILRQEVEDRGSAGDGRRQRFCIEPDRFDLRVVQGTLPHVVSMLDRVPHLDSGRPIAILSSLPPSVQYAGRARRTQEEGPSTCRGTDWSRQRSSPFSCLRPATRQRRRPRPPRGVSPGRIHPRLSAGVRRDAGLHRGRSQRPDLHRPADRRAAPAPRARVRREDRGEDQRRHRPVQRPLSEGPDRRRDRDEQLPGVRLRPAVDGRLRHARLPGRPVGQGQERSGHQVG